MSQGNGAVHSSVLSEVFLLVPNQCVKPERDDFSHLFLPDSSVFCTDIALFTFIYFLSVFLPISILFNSSKKLLRFVVIAAQPNIHFYCVVSPVASGTVYRLGESLLLTLKSWVSLKKELITYGQTV